MLRRFCVGHRSMLSKTCSVGVLSVGLLMIPGIALAQDGSVQIDGSQDSASDSDSSTANSADDSDQESSATASQPDSDQKPSDPAEEKPDLDSALMGEFVGEVKTEAETTQLALQIRPVGGSQFEAISYIGGLPGTDGCVLDQTNQYVGLLSGETLILSGGKQAIFVDADGCTVVGRDGTQSGRLQRVIRQSDTLGASPPDGAIVIYGGPDNMAVDGSTTEDGLLNKGALIQPMAQDFDMHVEFRLPLMSNQDGQSRGNSGIYLQSRYECQVLDSFATLPVFNGCGSLYRFRKPILNACFPPGTWQTYDIHFTAARWNADGSKSRETHITSWLNGILVQDDVALPGPTGLGKSEAATLLPTKLQDHGDAVVFRNVWMIDRGLTSGIKFPIRTQ